MGVTSTTLQASSSSRSALERTQRQHAPFPFNGVCVRVFVYVRACVCGLLTLCQSGVAVSCCLAAAARLTVESCVYTGWLPIAAAKTAVR